MKYFVFKSPRKKGDAHINELAFEPTEFMVQQQAVKYGSIVILSAAEVVEADKDEQA